MIKFLCLFMLLATPAFANVFGGLGTKLWSMVQDQFFNLVVIAVGAILGWLHNKSKQRFELTAKTLKEGGEAITQLGNAMLSGNNDDLKQVVKEAKDVFDVYKPTPERYIEPPQ